MSVAVLTAIWRAPPCKAGDLLVLLAIADNADEYGFAWPSIPTLARKANMSERGVQKCLQKLKEAGLIEIRPSTGRGRSNEYQITTNGIEPEPDHKKGEQSSPSDCSPFTGQKGEQSSPLNPERVNRATEKGELGFTPTIREPSLDDDDDARANGSSPFPDQKGEQSSPLPPEPAPTDRERILECMGHDPSGLNARGQIAGTQADMLQFEKWRGDLGLDLDEILGVIREVMARRPKAHPPCRFSYFTDAMREFAGEKARPALQPVTAPDGAAHRESAEERMRKLSRIAGFQT